LPEVKAACRRSLVNGMASSANAGTGVTISGIHPIKEDSVTHLSSKLISGDYFTSEKRNPILVSERLANKLKVDMGNKVILTFQDVNGNITAGAFRIIGIFKTGNSVYDDMNVFVRSDDLSNLAGIPGASHEMAVLLSSDNNLVTVQEKIKQLVPALTVENWKELAPELRLVIESYDSYM
jgi:ABC-type lipoprotein release transport system permease subunit